MSNRIEIQWHHPQERLTRETKAILLDYAIEHPDCASRRLAEVAASLAQRVSHTVIVKMLSRNDLGTFESRVEALQARYRGRELDLSRDQIEAIAKVNPFIRDIESRSDAPGRRLIQCVLWPRQHVVIDAYSLVVFLRQGDSFQQDMVHLLQCQVLPFFSSLRLAVEEIHTEDGPLFGRTDGHPFKVYLQGSGISHKPWPRGTYRQCGSLERFKKLLRSDRGLAYLPRGKGQLALDTWSVRFNSRGLSGYPHYGRSPWDMLSEYVNGAR